MLLPVAPQCRTAGGAGVADEETEIVAVAPGVMWLLDVSDQCSILTSALFINKLYWVLKFRETYEGDVGEGEFCRLLFAIVIATPHPTPAATAMIRMAMIPNTIMKTLRFIPHIFPLDVSRLLFRSGSF